MTPQVIAFLVGLSVFFAILGITTPKKQNIIGGRLAQKIQPTTPEEEFTLENANNETAELYDKYMRPLLRAFFPQGQMTRSLTNRNRKKNVELLVQSGNPWNLRPEEYAATQFLAAIAMSVVGIVLAVINPVPMVPGFVWILFLGPLGFFIPLSVMRSAREVRFNDIRKELPEALDLLVVTMGSGKNLEPAISSVTPLITDGVLKEEFKRINSDIAVGRSLESALTEFARRVPTDEVESFTKSVILAQQQGSDVNDTLERQSDSARSSYKSLLEKKMSTLSQKMMAALVPTMVPAFMLIFIAPTAQTLMTSF